MPLFIGRKHLDRQVEQLRSELAQQIQTSQYTVIEQIQQVIQHIPLPQPSGQSSPQLGTLLKQVEDIKVLLFQLIPPDIDKVDLNAWHTIFMQRMLAMAKVLEELKDIQLKTEKSFYEADRVRSGILGTVHSAMADFLPREQTTDPMRKVDIEQPPEENPPQPA